MQVRIRERREARGWTQQDLAVRAGVTRQLVGAVEAGRHAPNVLAAIALASALDTTVEALFEPPHDELVPALGVEPEPSTGVLAAQVGERLVAVPAPDRAGNPERWALVDAEVGDGGQLEWMPDRRTDGLVVAGCDPVVGLLADLVERTSSFRVLPVHASTGRSLAALRAGTVHGVLVHARTGALPDPPVPVRRWHVARWLVGLAAAGRGGPPRIEELAARRAHVVQREVGAGSQQALERALRATGATEPLPGRVGDGHLDVARRVRAGAGRAGVTMEAAARAFGLGFSPLEEHEVELWLDERWAASPAATVLVDVLHAGAFLRRAEHLAGYDLTGCGTAR